MDSIRKFLSSIYLGDRFCEGLIIEKDRISFQINLISRLEKGTSAWNYYSKEDLEHGHLVFDGVTEWSINRSLPFNDEICEIEILNKTDGIYTFVVHGVNVSDDFEYTELEMTIKAKSFYLFDPQNNFIVTE